jgi:hypothetical protein
LYSLSPGICVSLSLKCSNLSSKRYLSLDMQSVNWWVEMRGSLDQYSAILSFLTLAP